MTPLIDQFHQQPRAVLACQRTAAQDKVFYRVRGEVADDTKDLSLLFGPVGERCDRCKGRSALLAVTGPARYSPRIKPRRRICSSVSLKMVPAARRII